MYIEMPVTSYNHYSLVTINHAESRFNVEERVCVSCSARSRAVEQH